MATIRRVFTLRLPDEVFDQIGRLASKDRRSMTNYIEVILRNHLAEVERREQEAAGSGAHTEWHPAIFLRKGLPPAFFRR